jgi:predicted outer membrane protein
MEDHMIDSRPRRYGRRRWVTRLASAAGIGLLVATFPATASPVYAGPAPAREAAQAAAYASGYAQQAQGAVPAQAPILNQVDDVVETEWGPLTNADRDLLIRVKFAGLWEIPAGEMAVEKGEDARVREIGAFIRDEHIELDAATEEVAAQLGVDLPDQPFSENQLYLDRMEAADGGDFDIEFVQRLREAHGQIYPLIAYVRAGTQNTLISDFADVGEEFVGRHMEYLESTGLVQWVHIPPPPGPAGAPTRFLSADPAGVNPLFIWLILGASAIAGTITVIRTVRPR